MYVLTCRYWWKTTAFAFILCAELTASALCGGTAVLVGQLAGHIIHVHLPQGWQGRVVKLVLHISQLCQGRALCANSGHCTLPFLTTEEESGRSYSHVIALRKIA